MQGRIVFATGNAGKIKEIRMIMEDTGLEVVSMKDAGIKACRIETDIFNFAKIVFSEMLAAKIPAMCGA